MTITLPKKIFGRDVEGGIERALTRASVEQDKLGQNANANNDTTPTPNNPNNNNPTYNVHPSKIDWSKFVISGRIYTVNQIEEKGKENFIRMLRRHSKATGGIVSRDDISYLLLSNNASNQAHIDAHINEITDRMHYFPDRMWGLRVHVYLKQCVDVGNKTILYKIE
jgi:hypothetical protein